MTNDRLGQLFTVGGQSPWLDNLGRGPLRDGSLRAWKARGIRGITSNPTIFQKAITGSALYDTELAASIARHGDPESAYWDLVCSDIAEAADLFRDLYDDSGGNDGFVSIEVAPTLAHDTEGTVSAARVLWERLARPNIMIKIPATDEGIAAVSTVTGLGINVNVTLIFGLRGYARVLDAYQSGLEALAARDAGRVTQVASVASFFISRVDQEIDRRLAAIGSPTALALQGRAAVAQAKLAYAHFLSVLDGDRWSALAQAGARPQRPLWASTSTKNPAYPDTLYVDPLIGPLSVNTLPEATAEAFSDHGSPVRSVDNDVESARVAWEAIRALGVDVEDVAGVLEHQGVDAFIASYRELLDELTEKSKHLS
jgi:transaldolase